MVYLGWTYPDLMACPEAYLAVIREHKRDEDRQRRSANARTARRRR